MAKLQKSLKQRQHHSMRHSRHVAKLTPSEIRSLNNNIALVSKTGSQSSSKGTSSPARSRRSTNATPPATPDDPSASPAQAHRNPGSRNNSVNLQTPPHTPNEHRRSSQSSTHGHHHGHPVQSHANGIIHAPRPRGSAQAAFMVANGISSRPSSSGSSNYRGFPTYRGPEVTRTGSINMLQRPSPTIVTNPLSNFSRPRQSMVSSSPERCRQESQDIGILGPQSLRNGRANSLPSVSAPSSRQPSPPRVTDSPVSMIVDGTEKFPVLDPVDDPHNQPKIQDDDEDAQNESKPRGDDQTQEISTTPVDRSKEVAEPKSPGKKDKPKRFTISTALFGGDKSHQDGAENASKLKKARRRTLSFTKSDGIEKSSPEVPTTAPPEEVQVDGATIENGDFAAHPSVRPLSLIIPGEFKGKEKEIYSGPVYARCACCGKLKRPPGYTNGLTPVVENENLRTNFSFEIERTSDTTARRSSDASRGKFTPIIPMEVGESETRQATIEPPISSSSPMKQQNQYTSMPPPTRQQNQYTSPARRPKRHSDPPRFVRFGSLHGRRNADPTVITEEDEDEVDENQPLMTEQANPDQTGVTAHDFAVMDEVVTSQPVFDSETDRAVVEAKLNEQLLTTEVPEPISRRPSNTGSESDNFFTPVPGTTPVVEDQSNEKQDAEQTMLLNRENSFLGLPEPQLGPDFAPSNATLGELVLAPSTNTVKINSLTDLGASGAAVDNGEKNILEGLEKSREVDAERHKGQKWVAEVMAV
ncbi:uncharacterized protein Z518_06939 [Rhinocladiella mackenziei CBS 650.93]|uniref:Uncharacterized protein n=1 Tax=Rhinocladiella mackenziei CBS 650.93 TaxID=1442369 RepID=A0A0D2FMV2_9EURO|nr:uncharacterized protein Z518_06939 [Rhinocladiella mackenziei CBS 650.93]KIX03387.1 hypothetical protein Z518_06939 [Rhinocladiella mackenziei CBS 650.93]